MEKIPDIIHSSWHKHLQPIFNDNKMLLLRDSILANCSFYPNLLDVFKVFTMPIEDIKVVVLGQDPYPNGEATGLAFAVNKESKIPASLRVIHNEIINEKLRFDNPIEWRTLEHWTKQGVFLLNTALTVEVGNANSHTGYWQWFTKEVIKIISQETTIKPIWMLWGAKAQTFSGYIQGHKLDYKFASSLSEDCVYVNFLLQAPHPAAELYGGKNKFTGCNHFRLCNEILEIRKQEKIVW